MVAFIIYLVKPAKISITIILKIEENNIFKQDFLPAEGHEEDNRCPGAEIGNWGWTLGRVICAFRTYKTPMETG